MKCVAIDDEPIALSIINEYCRRYGDIELETFSSPVAGLECIEREHPDVVFLDIEMNSHNGLELAKRIPGDICVIFTTAYAQYALDGFNVDAVDFLHKPIFYPRFERAMEKAKRMLGLNQGTEPEEDGLTLRVEHKNVIVKFADIVFIEAMDNYVKIVRKNLPPVITQITMKEIEGRLTSDKFIRVHRSYIVAGQEFENYSNRQIFLRNVVNPIPVGRKYKDAFKEFVGK